MEPKKNTRWLYRSQSGVMALSAKKAGKSSAAVVTTASRGEVAAATVQFKAGAKHVLELRSNTAKVIRNAISTPISDTQRTKAMERAERVRAAENPAVTARFQRS
ncbi:hypothetical protein [Rugamonas aquatica]|uniref:hypothetical protein n=1 Tax=Rugamonas aquatica TaxID=2743357 RepID=UPI0015825E96|nr:hypothetical protein [Rugamonas aquatica]